MASWTPTTAPERFGAEPTSPKLVESHDDTGSSCSDDPSDGPRQAGHLTITRGLPGSGKTTWAKAYCAATRSVRVEAKELRRMLYGDMPDTAATDGGVVVAVKALVTGLLREGIDVVLDGEHLRSWILTRAMVMAQTAGAEFTIKDLTDVPPDECIRRDIRREPNEQAGAERIQELFRRHLATGVPSQPLCEHRDNTRTRAASPPPGAPPAIIVDIDGTVALPRDRHPEDMSRVDTDLPNPAVIETVEVLAAAGMRLVYCTSRPESVRDATLRWITQHIGPPVDALFMRALGDQREDFVVKREIFHGHIAPVYRVHAVFEDRSQVVAMWRNLGLQVFQVDDGDF